MKTEVPKSTITDKDELARLCDLNFNTIFHLTHDGDPVGVDVNRVQNYTLDVTGGDIKKRGVEWIDSIWDKPQVLSYELESISALFDDLSLSMKMEEAVKEHLERVKS